ncbi:hypothetical protein IQ07DRAFT_175390 [Pyrenochaeta sp. DS3sAY3a]|nr:hypothetical protein IQ07DRAFT_175390 [Pyrenochaeta sp. DS3sAY3a]
MDIQKWLEETVQSDPASPASQAGIEPRVLINKAGTVHRSSHKRRQSRSDSSLLPSPPRQKPLTKKRKPPTVESTTHESAGSEVSEATHTESAESSTSSQRYARKPRRKTRPERYEPSSKPVPERGRHAHGPPKGESKKSRRKSRRRKGEKPGSGIVQSFHAKNVSRDRLTLKPREQLGIFNKGKTSTAVKGRGLPDLVFSEMKFLQRHKDQPEPTLNTGVSKKKRPKDQAHAKEGEISAFFTSVRPPLVGNAENDSTKEDYQTKTLWQNAHHYAGDKSSAIEAALPTIEVQHQKPLRQSVERGSHHQSTDCVSWSESIRAPSTLPAHPRTQPVICTDASGTVSRRVAERIPEQESSEDKPQIQPLSNEAIYEGSARPEGSSTKVSYRRGSRSHSFPQRTSSLPRTNLVDKAAKFRNAVRADYPSSVPASMPVNSRIDTTRMRSLGDHGESRSKAASLNQTTTYSDDRAGFRSEVDYKAMEPEASSDFERVLRQCEYTRYQKGQEDGSPQAHGLHASTVPTANEMKQPLQTGSWPLIDGIPTIRCLDGKNSASTIPNFASAGIYEQQARRQQSFVHPEVPMSLIEGFRRFEEFFLDENGHGMYAEEAYEDDPLERASEKSMRTRGDFEAEEANVAGDCVQQPEQEREIVASGFWRPNKLY